MPSFLAGRHLCFDVAQEPALLGDQSRGFSLRVQGEERRANMPTRTAESTVPSRRPTMLPSTARPRRSEARTSEQSNRTLMLPKFLRDSVEMTMTRPSPGMTVALLMISRLMPAPSTALPTTHMTICQT